MEGRQSKLIANCTYVILIPSINPPYRSQICRPLAPLLGSDETDIDLALKEIGDELPGLPPYFPPIEFTELPRRCLLCSRDALGSIPTSPAIRAMTESMSTTETTPYNVGVGCTVDTNPDDVDEIGDDSMENCEEIDCVDRGRAGEEDDVEVMNARCAFAANHGIMNELIWF